MRKRRGELWVRGEEAAHLREPLEEVAAAAQLRHEREGRVRLEDVEQPHEIDVLQLLPDSDLVVQELERDLIAPVFFHLFHRHQLSRRNAARHAADALRAVHSTKRPLAYLLPELERVLELPPMADDVPVVVLDEIVVAKAAGALLVAALELFAHPLLGILIRPVLPPI